MALINIPTQFEEDLTSTIRKVVKKAVGNKRFKGDLFDAEYNIILVNITVQVCDGVNINEDGQIIEEAVSDSLDDLNQGDDYLVFALGVNRISDKKIAYTVLIRAGTAVLNDWPQGDDLLNHIESYLTDEELKASVKGILTINMNL